MAVSEKSILDKIEKSSLAEELKREQANNELAFDTKYSHKADLENLLKLAEHLKEKCDEKATHIRILRFLQVIGTIFLLVILVSTPYIFASYLGYSKYHFIAVCIGLVSPVFLVMHTEFFIVNTIKKQYLADKLALSEVLQLLRETSNIVAEQEYWSVLSRAEFRIRLSRFTLDEKTKSAFNFFS